MVARRVELWPPMAHASRRFPPDDWDCLIYSGYKGLSDLEQVVSRTARALEAHRERFDSIVVTGMSGVVVGAPVAVATGIPLVIVRKKSDQHHNHDGGEIVNVDAIGASYLFLDDFKSTGATLRRVRGVIHYHDGARYAGAYYYGANGDIFGNTVDGFCWAIPKTVTTAWPLGFLTIAL
jgi:adenine/guanine phosphoribosyltransferase-like PRPP-binding protein